ncbi:MAG: hypothetical protein QOG43_1749 [Actinomycetota bacterium]|jgi:SpoVK/Ycf46/Vps4 family AAA+-type ATPase|nr:hypothetical protein [Actinomycetota bacterium]
MQPAVGLRDLRILAPQIDVLARLADDVRAHRKPAGEAGGFTILMAGGSKTSRVLAAEALAHELTSALFRVDLTAVISKFIGETEKNLRRLFDAAEEGGAVLFFDEADALFGKRTETAAATSLLDRVEKAALVAVFSLAGPAGVVDPDLYRRLRVCVNL